MTPTVAEPADGAAGAAGAAGTVSAVSAVRAVCAVRAVSVNELVEMARFVAQTVPRLPADSQRKLVALALAVPAAQIAVADAETEVFVFDLGVVAEHSPATLVRLFELASRERARVSTPRA